MLPALQKPISDAACLQGDFLGLENVLFQGIVIIVIVVTTSSIFLLNYFSLQGRFDSSDFPPSSVCFASTSPGLAGREPLRQGSPSAQLGGCGCKYLPQLHIQWAPLLLCTKTPASYQVPVPPLGALCCLGAPWEHLPARAVLFYTSYLGPWPCIPWTSAPTHPIFTLPMLVCTPWRRENQDVLASYFSDLPSSGEF